jgi:methylmalonyl-CoA mutase N-terminal domain/subunit
VVVGLNRFVTDPVSFDVFTIDPASEAEQVSSLAAVKARRDPAAVAAGLAAVRAAATSGENVVPACVEAVSAYATVGEIADVLRDVYGAWQPIDTF